MSLTAIQQYEFGGVDSRSNPLNLPTNRSLRTRNIVPMRDGHLQLRWGYAPVNMSAVTPGVIHSIVSMRKLGGAKQTIFWIGKTPFVRGADGTISSPTVRGTAIQSAAPWTYAFSGGKLHAYNGTDKKFYDGDKWRDIGLRALTAAEVAGTTVTIGAANANALAASSVDGAQPGYQLYACIYNRITGHVGNRIKIGARCAPSVASELNIAGLPDLSGIDTEWDILIGRTGDGAEIPYVCANLAGDWFYVPNGQTTAVLNVSEIDGKSELPTRNAPPPAFARIVRAGSRLFGNKEGEEFVYYSETEADAAQDGSYEFVGDAAQCWPTNNVQTFPSGAPLVGLHEYNGEAWCHSREQLAILSDLSGVLDWQGPWNGGIAGQEAFTDSPNGPFWASPEKQLLTMSQTGPVPASDEYEVAELSRIGDAYLSTIQTRYLRDPEKQIDHIVIKALTEDGVPFRVIHDFNLKDARSILGQGYSDEYYGDLASDYWLAVVRDDNDRMKLWAGADNGQLYELNSGANDNGLEYDSDMIFLLNAGPDRPAVSYIEWFGDKNLRVSIAQTLDSGLANFKSITESFEVVPGGENDFQYRVSLDTPEAKFAYVRFQLRSHSDDGNLELNEPVHIPLEDYGRIYMVAPLLNGERGH